MEADASHECTIDGVAVELRYDPRLDIDRAFAAVCVGAIEGERELPALQTFMGINFLLYADSHAPVYCRRPDTHEYVLKFACDLAALSCDEFAQQLQSVLLLAQQWHGAVWPVAVHPTRSNST